MTLAYWCVLVAGLLPIVGAGVAKWGARDYDNHDPRAWLAAQSGRRARANAAQANSFEALPLFAAAVIIAHLAQAAQGTVDLLAGLFIVFRVAYLWCYVTDRAGLRSLVWCAALLCVIGLFVAAARA